VATLPADHRGAVADPDAPVPLPLPTPIPVTTFR
jgi:hypothetical protein